MGRPAHKIGTLLHAFPSLWRQRKLDFDGGIDLDLATGFVAALMSSASDRKPATGSRIF